MPTASLRVTCDPTAVRVARVWVAGSLRAWGVTPTRFHDVVLLVSELAANAVQHAGTDFDVGVASDGRTVFVTVTEGDPVVPVMRTVGADAVSGRGLHVVNMLADAWGVELRPGGGKTVWFEVATGGAPPTG